MNTPTPVKPIDTSFSNNNPVKQDSEKCNGIMNTDDGIRIIEIIPENAELPCLFRYLPQDLFPEIASYLNAFELKSLRSTCNFFRTQPFFQFQKKLFLRIETDPEVLSKIQQWTLPIGLPINLKITKADIASYIEKLFSKEVTFTKLTFVHNILDTTDGIQDPQNLLKACSLCESSNSLRTSVTDVSFSLIDLGKEILKKIAEIFVNLERLNIYSSNLNGPNEKLPSLSALFFSLKSLFTIFKNNSHLETVYINALNISQDRHENNNEFSSNELSSVNIKNLTIFKQHAPLLDSEANTISQLTKLKILTIKCFGLSKEAIENIQQCRNLQNLTLRYSNKTELESSIHSNIISLTKLPSLKSLTIGPIRSSRNGTIYAQISDLELLSLSVNDPQSDELTSLTTLDTLLSIISKRHPTPTLHITFPASSNHSPT